MERQKLINFINQVLPIAPQKVEELASHFQAMHLKKNEYFTKAGTICNNYLFLENGFIRAFTFDLDGNEVTTEFYSNNQIVFEVGSFFQKIPSNENFQALEDCNGWYINYDQLQTLFHSAPEFREFGRMVLVKGFISFKQRTLSLINQSAEQRYATLIKARPEIFQKAPLKSIASYLGITDTSLSRIRRELAHK
ncbi:MAG: Crp/Fnr family transcriptional regulator [Bacteroidota bacterium]|nr:Crp/Fnr family transcriptional regulator [Bacteroidota bacterium]